LPGRNRFDPPALPVWPAVLLFLTLALALAGLGILIYALHRVAPSSDAATFHVTAAAEAPAVFFAPGSSPTAVIVEQLNAARRTVHVQAYSFTSAPIAKALVAAEKRGVDLEAILDKSNQTANY
jgi:phosphatidylserine/phosphatidylglycerophosphate/cardiolipin synthase-like enzyme